MTDLVLIVLLVPPIVFFAGRTLLRRFWRVDEQTELLRQIKDRLDAQAAQADERKRP